MGHVSHNFDRNVYTIIGDVEKWCCKCRLPVGKHLPHIRGGYASFWKQRKVTTNLIRKDQYIFILVFYFTQERIVKV